MTQHRYLVNYNKRVLQVAYFTAYHPNITVDSGERILEMRVMKSTGKTDKSKVTLYLGDRGQAFTFTSLLTAAAIKSRIRKLRDSEAEKLDAIDMQLETLRQERKGLLRAAWTKANVVTLKEVVEKLKPA